MTLQRMTILLALSVALGLVACRPAVDWEADKEYFYLTITLSEDDATNAIEKALTPHIINAQADLRDGQIFASGQVKQEKTGKLLSGSLTLELWAENGVLNAKITSLDFGGWDASQEKLGEINQDIADGVAGRVANKESRSELTDVTVSDGEIAFTFRMLRKK
jgi:hypothetical protein